MISHAFRCCAKVSGGLSVAECLTTSCCSATYETIYTKVLWKSGADCQDNDEMLYENGTETNNIRIR